MHLFWDTMEDIDMNNSYKQTFHPSSLFQPCIHARTIEQDLVTDSGNGNGSTYKIKQLFNRHGYNLAILRGHVKGRAFFLSSVSFILNYK